MWEPLDKSCLMRIAMLAVLFILTISCRYKYPEKHDPSKIRLCVSNRWIPWLNSSTGMLNENTTIFCNANSLVHDYFTLVRLPIPLFGEVHTNLIEESCDMVISVTSGLYFHATYNGTRNIPLVLAYPFHNSDILLTWSNKVKWRQWMIDNGFGKYIAKTVDLANPAGYPFILKDGLSENSQGVHVIEDTTQLQAKLTYFKERNITELFGEEALTGMGRAQGIFYVSAFQGKLLNIQCYVYLIKQVDIAQQNFTKSIFIAGRPANLQPVRGNVFRVKNDYEVSSVLRKITKKGMYTGVFCAEFKMNNFKQIIFMEFNARICFKLTQKDTYFVEAYLPLAFSLQKHIRTIKPYTRRLYKIVSGSHRWYQNKTLHYIAKGYHMYSSDSEDSYFQLPTIAEVIYGYDNASAV